MAGAGERYDVVVIGSGFGGTITALSLARAFKHRARGERILMLERGTWWTTPVGTVQDKEVKTYGFLREQGQPVQFWSSAENFRGFLDLYTRCVRRKGNEDGLFDLTMFGRKGLFGLRENDGVTILRASGVGGGSLVYANVTIRPPNAVLEDPRWPLTWSAQQRDESYELARDAIGLGVVRALYDRDVAADPSKAVPTPPNPVNTGLSNVATRSARLSPRWKHLPDPLNPRRGLRRLDPAHSTPGDGDNAVWIDRARVFQTQIASLTDELGMVDSSINDINPEPGPFETKGAPKNYCERQGRCIIGCLPGARHTLNKQLMGAILGTPKGDPPAFPDLDLKALCEVDVVEALSGGGYRVHYDERDPENPGRATKRTITADRVTSLQGPSGRTRSCCGRMSAARSRTSASAWAWGSRPTATISLSSTRRGSESASPVARSRRRSPTSHRGRPSASTRSRTTASRERSRRSRATAYPCFSRCRRAAGALSSCSSRWSSTRSGVGRRSFARSSGTTSGVRTSSCLSTSGPAT